MKRTIQFENWKKPAAFLLKQGISCLAGFLFSRIRIGEGMAPFGLSAAGGAANDSCAAAALGAAAGYLLTSDTLSALKLVSAAMLICFIRLGTAKLFTGTRRLLVSAGAVFLSLFACSLIVSAVDGLDWPRVLFSLAEAAVAAAGACFVYRVCAMPFPGTAADSADTAAFLLTFFMTVLSLDSLPLGGFSPAHMLAGLAVMIFASGADGTFTLAAGAAAGVILGTGGEREQLLFSLPLAGLMGMICSGGGKAAIAAGFAVSDLLALILRGDVLTAGFSLAETAFAVLLFLVLPGRLRTKLADLLAPVGGGDRSAGISGIIRYRLTAAARAVRDVGNSVSAVSKLLEKTDVPDPSSIAADAAQEACEGCVKREFCWDRSGKLTEKAFADARETLFRKGALCFEDLPDRLKIVCRGTNTVCASFNRLFCEYNARLTARAEIFESRELAAMQFMSASAVLEDAAGLIPDGDLAEPATAAAAADVFEEFGFTAENVLAFSDASGRSTLSAFCTGIPKYADYEGLTGRLFERTGRSYMLPAADDYSDLGTLLNFREATRFTAVCHTASRAQPGERFCGDTCETFTDARGCFYAVLSDGMGRGTRAALDSVMTCSLTSRLLRAGFTPECAVNAVNSALIVKSAEETLATLDILKLDLNTLEAWFYKAGAAFSVVRQGDRTAVIERSSLPLGILSDVKSELTRASLSSGDRVLLMSDGASVLSPAYFRDALRKGKNKDAKTFAEEAADNASGLSPAGSPDDITVVCVDIL